VQDIPRLCLIDSNEITLLHDRLRVCVLALQIFSRKRKMTDNGEASEEKTDPGASRHGNFMNYYQFRRAEERVRQLPCGVWQRRRVAHPDRKYAGLDVGCNSGVRERERENRDAAVHRGAGQPKRDDSLSVIRNYKRRV